MTGLGAAASLLLADWLGKVAPIGIGGVRFVKTSESLLDHVDLYQERQRFLDMAGPIEPELEELLE